MRWLPEYGCAILCYHDDRMFTGTYSIQVLGIDKHAFYSHTGKSSYEINSKSSSFVCLPIGSVCGAEEVTNLFDKFECLRSKARDRTGDQRSAAGGRQGHQFTPSMVEALLRQAISCKCEKNGKKCKCPETKPNGGFTDVGLHTGGKHRATCSALVFSVYDWLLEQLPIDYKLTFLAVMSHFHIFIIKQMNEHRQVMILKEKPLTKRDGFSNFLFFIIQRLACDASRLSNYGHDMSRCYNFVHVIKEEITKNIKHWDHDELKDNELIEMNSSIQLEIKKDSVVKVPQPNMLSPSSHRSESDIRKFVDNNLGAISYLTMEQSIHSAVTWSISTQRQINGSRTNMMFFLSNIESFFWMLSEKKLDEQALGTSDIAHIVTLVDKYRLMLEKLKGALRKSWKETVKEDGKDKTWKEIENINAVKLVTNLRCHEILVVWLSYCLVFNSISKNYPQIMKDFGVALQISDLQHLVLHNKIHRDVLERVVLFLHKNRVPNLDIFSLRSFDSWNSATFQMGKMYTERHLLTIYENQEKDANTRVNEHWERVQGKKRLAKRLRTELGSLEYTLDQAEHKERKARDMYNCSSRRYGFEYDELKKCTKWSKNLRLQIDGKKTEIEEAERSPAPVIQPLPKNREKAMKVLFFLHMPDNFRALARLTFTAQQLLIPSPWNCDIGGADGTDSFDAFSSVKQPQQLSKAWFTHYNKHQKLYNGANTRFNNPQGCDGSVGLTMETNDDVKPINPKHIDNLRSPSDGVWYPDDRGIKMSWTGGTQPWDIHSSRDQFNPFLIAAIFTGRKYGYIPFKVNARNTHGS